MSQLRYEKSWGGSGFGQETVLRHENTTNLGGETPLGTHISRYTNSVYTDFKNTINAYFSRMWQNHWSQIQFNKLQNIKPIIGETKLKNVTKRRDEVVLHRARIGHTFLTHSYLLKKEDGPDCSSCNCLLTV